MTVLMDYGHPETIAFTALHGREFNPNPKFLGTADAYFAYHIGLIFQISLIYALAVPKNLGVGLNFQPCREGYFFSGPP